MSTLKFMREQLSRAHQEGLVDEVRSISEIEGAPRDATQVVICYLALEAARGSYEALVACAALKDYEKNEKKESD